MPKKPVITVRVLPHVYQGWLPSGKLVLRPIPHATAKRVGRILLSHLMLDHYVDRYMAAVAPSDFDCARPQLRFVQKLDLLSGPGSFLADRNLIPGLRRVNKIRNALAHDLEAQLSLADVAPLAAHLKHAARGRAKLPADPISIVETFTALVVAEIVGFMGALDVAKNPVLQEALRSRAAANNALQRTHSRVTPLAGRAQASRHAARR